MRVSLFFHVLSAVIWVGGMFFAYVCLRPAAVEALEPRQRLKLWAATLHRFFPWVWAAVAIIIGSGFHMIGAMGEAGKYVYVMLAIGLIMSVIFAYVAFGPFAELKHQAAQEQWQAAGQALSRIRVLVGVNLGLGLLTIGVATMGPLVG